MKNRKLFLLIVLIVPWITTPLLGMEAFKRYAPAAIFMVTFTKAINLFGENKGWWRFYKGIGPLNSMNFFNFGPYLITSLWMLKITYRKFPLYLILNLVLHFSFIYLGGLQVVKHYKIASLQNLSKFQYFLIDTLRALILYGFQYINDLNLRKKMEVRN